MFDILLSISIAFTITYLSIPVIIFVANSKKLYDVPDARKIHDVPIPSLGGLGIFAGFVMASLTIINFSEGVDFQYYFAAFFVIFFLGLKDDILDITPIKKFIGQVGAAFLIIYKGNIQIQSMHGFLGIDQLPPPFSLIFTYLTVIVIINSFNLIDGVDGLAGSLALMAVTIFGIYFYKVGMMPYSILAFATAGSLIAFLIFNFQPAKVFMGDTGSLLLGLINAILVIKFINVANMPNVPVPVLSAPAVGFAILMIPLLDTLRVFGIRIGHRRSPFSPDRNHIHHLLLDRGLSHRTITIALVGANLILIIAVYMLRGLDCTALILGIFAIFFAAIGMLYYSRRKRRLFVAKSVSN
ncbi:MAG TPA: MraY family glycosyltransferase, partial [Chitinophagaceae bacterium]|nr:MraY family glycosyltransferase [Chitinophagaceae bacterium]